MSADANVDVIFTHSAAHNPEFAAGENRAPWAAICTVGALVAFYLVLILTLLAGQPAPTTPTNATTPQSVAPSTTLGGVGP